MLLADIQRKPQGSADVILFNIDAKADAKSDRDAILQVFLRVFNEKLGYTGDSPDVAEMALLNQQRRLRNLSSQHFRLATDKPGNRSAMPSISCVMTSSRSPKPWA